MKDYTDKERLQKITELCWEFGQIDGDHHKAWVIDKILQMSVDEYDDFIEQYEENGEYSWDAGIAP